jgi:RNA polymerase sigma-70 factor (ECF subfamily)
MDSGQESELIAKCRRGDEAAWNALFDLHYDAVGRFVYQLSGNFSREDAEEICQEVFLTVIRSLNTFRGNSQLQTWIFRIAANKSRDYLARQNAAKRGGGHVPLPLHPTGEAGPDELPPLDPPSPAPAPDAQLDQSERADLIVHALGNLEAPCREMIELRYFADMSYEELGLTFQINTKTVSSRLSRCMDRLESLVRGKAWLEET